MPETNANAEKRDGVMLIMLPYAGGSAQAYYRLARSIKNKVDIQIETIEYAGHGTRFRKKFANDFNELVEDAESQIIDRIERYLEENDKSSIILFGHSMGGVVLAHILDALYSKFGDSLKGIIFSSCLPPDKIQAGEPYFQTDQQLVDYLCMARSIPVDVANSKEFKQYILPYVKNDFRILGEYDSKLNALPKCTIYGIWANLDYGITKENMIGWQKYSNSPIYWYEAKGTHFYFEENETMAADIIIDIINKCKGENNDC